MLKIKIIWKHNISKKPLDVTKEFKETVVRAHRKKTGENRDMIRLKKHALS